MIDLGTPFDTQLVSMLVSIASAAKCNSVVLSPPLGSVLSCFEGAKRAHLFDYPQTKGTGELQLNHEVAAYVFSARLISGR